MDDRSGPADPCSRRRFLVGLGALPIGCTTIYNGARFPARGAAGRAKNATPNFADVEDKVLMRYMRTGGLYLRWRGESLLFAPFVSNPRLGKARCGPFESLVEHIELDFKDPQLRPTEIGSIIVGHSHYDHLGDVPYIARHLAVNAEIWVNETGKNMLAGHRDLRDRIRVIEPYVSRRLDHRGRLTHFRWKAVPLDHAKIMKATHYSPGFVDEPWTDPDWTNKKFYDLRGGQAHAFLLELLDGATEEAKVAEARSAAKVERVAASQAGDAAAERRSEAKNAEQAVAVAKRGAVKAAQQAAEQAEQAAKRASKVVFSLFYQDAGTDPPGGFPSRPLCPVDLAVLCVPGYHTTRKSAVKRKNWNYAYPGQLLEHLRAKHMLAIHWESMFKKAYNRKAKVKEVALQPLTGPLRFGKFLAECERVVGSHQHKDKNYQPDFLGLEPQGIAKPQVTVPIPLEWFTFAIDSDKPQDCLVTESAANSAEEAGPH